MSETPNRRIARLAVPLSVILAFVVVYGLWDIRRDTPDMETAEPVSYESASFVDSKICGDCHASEFEAWMGSHHDLAMQVAKDGTVLGDFSDRQFSHHGITSRFYKRDGRFYVNTEGPDGEMADFEIEYTFGVEPLQQYLVAFPGGRLQCLQIAWDTDKRRWFHLQPGEDIAHDDPFHWTGRYQNWNTMCADCHSTDLQKNYDAATDTYDTQWHEIDVGCQACHGPGSLHVKWARHKTDIQKPDRSGLTIGYDEAWSQVDACAPCHSRRHRVSAERGRGRYFIDDYMVATLDEGLYHADGQILEEVYVYGSFVQSKMYAQGVRCTDCHNPHSLEPVAEGNAVCTQCHNPAPNSRFPTLPQKDYSLEEHHFHPLGSAGAQCVNCHMTEQTYMVVDPRRDHSFRIPRPDLSIDIGSPNACNQCHTDRSPEWANDAVVRWYGRERPKHYGPIIEAGRHRAPHAGKNLRALVTDEEQPAIVRATAIELIASYRDEAGPAMLSGVNDPDPLVRARAAGLLEQLPIADRISVATPMTRDSIRAVRIEATRVLATIPVDELDNAARAARAAALIEFEALQQREADFPGSHLNLAVVYTANGQLDRAEKAYLTAIAMDPGFLPARVNLANLYHQMGRSDDAERIFRDALGIAGPDARGELHYSLGLLLAELDRLDEAAVELGHAAELLSNRARVRYNYALALQHLGRRSDAESALLGAYSVDPMDSGIVHALAVFYVQDGEWSKALPYAERLVELVPGAPGPRQMLQQVRDGAVREGKQ